MIEMPLSGYTIKQAANAVDRVKSIDDTINSIRAMSGRMADISPIGELLRREIGRNILTQFTNPDLARIVLVAVQHALKDERDSVVKQFESIVTFPDGPKFTNPSAGHP